MAQIKSRLGVLLAERNMKLKDLSEAVGISETNLSLLKTGKAKAIRFSTLMSLCAALACQPGDLLAYDPAAPGLADDDDA
jgi:putative transcriptional regulator